MGLIIEYDDSTTLRSSTGGDTFVSSGEWPYIEIDLLLSEEVYFSGSATKKPVFSSTTGERSINFVSEYFIKEPVEITCECFHTNTPPISKDSEYEMKAVPIGKDNVMIGRRNLLSDQATAGIGAEDESVFDVNRSGGNTLTRSEDLYTRLTDLYERGTVCWVRDFKTRDGLWVIKALNFNKTPENAGGLEFTITFQEVKAGFVADAVSGNSRRSPRIERAREITRGGPPGQAVQSATETVTSVSNGTQPSLPGN